jgi:cobalt-zinc-cadmium efflux system outer membrane protein
MSGLRAATRAAIACCLAFIVVASSSRASAEERPRLPLSLAEALSRATARAPDVVMAKHATREAGARRVGAGVILPSNPRVSVDARPLIRGGPLPDVGYAAILEAPFEVGGAPSARVREAERHAELSRAELALEQLRARVAAWTAYVRAQVADERIASTRAAADIAQRMVEASRQRADLGAAGDIEQSLASSDAAQIDAQITDAIRERDLHLMELRDVLDIPSEQPIELTTPLGEPDPPPTADALVARALASRPELAVVKKRIDLLDATEERLEKETFPRVGVYVGVDASPANPMFGMLGLSVELPVAQRNAGPRALVRAERDGESDRAELLARRIAREVAATRAAFDARRAELDTLTTRALPAAQRTLDLVETGWRSGRFDIFRVTAAARDVARVRSLRLDALEAAWMERIALERVAGGIVGGGR